MWGRFNFPNKLKCTDILKWQLFYEFNQFLKIPVKRYFDDSGLKFSDLISMYKQLSKCGKWSTTIESSEKIKAVKYALKLFIYYVQIVLHPLNNGHVNIAINKI